MSPADILHLKVKLDKEAARLDWIRGVFSDFASGGMLGTPEGVKAMADFAAAEARCGVYADALDAFDARES